MGKVIVFASSKGGSGKTTAARLTASIIAEKRPESTIALIDADPNQHCAAWALLAGCPENIKLIQNSTESTIVTDIKQERASADFVLVDLEGIASISVTNAVNLSDLTVIMCQPAEDDLREALKTVQLIRDQQVILNRQINHAVLVTRGSASKHKTNLHNAILDDMQQNQVDVFDNYLHDRKAFKEMRSFGGTLQDQESAETIAKEREAIKKARLNAESVIDEILEKIDNYEEAK